MTEIEEFEAHFRKEKNTKHISTMLDICKDCIEDTKESIATVQNDSLVRDYKRKLSRLESEKVVLEKLHKEIISKTHPNE